MSGSRYKDVLTAAQEIGQAYRGDWSDFDGRTLRDQMNELANIADGTESLAQYRRSNGLCPVGGGHWEMYCHEECRAGREPT